MTRNSDLLAAVLTLVLVPSGGGLRAQSAADAETTLRRADRALAGLETLRAEFDQRTYNPVLERITTGHGVLVYLAPERFRIAYSDPEGDVVVNDGRHVWIYLPSSQPGQVIRQLSSESEVRNPLTYLRDLRGSYAAAVGGADRVAGRVADRLVLTPLGSGAPYMLLEVWVDRENGFPRQVRTRTDEGVATTYTFHELHPNTPLSESLFRFTPPRGTEIFDS